MWAPSGRHVVVGGGTIAYLDYLDDNEGGQLRLMNPVGGNVRTPGDSARRYWFGLDWSPDGEWIIVGNKDTRDLELIHTVTNLVIPLPSYTRFMRSPTWKPN